MATPASVAHDFFRRRSFASYALLWCSMPLLTLGMAAPGLRVVLRGVLAVVGLLRSLERRIPRSYMEFVPAMLLAFVGVSLTVSPAYGRLAVARRLAAGRLRVLRLVRAKREAWPQLVTTLVFALHALLPAISTYSAVSVILNTVFPAGESGIVDVSGWTFLHRISCAALAFYSFGSVMVQLEDTDRGENAEPTKTAGRAKRWAIWALGVSVKIMRGCCILAAWAYVWIAIDLGVSCLLGALGWHKARESGTALGVVKLLAWLLGADPGVSPLRSDKAISFLLNLVSVVSQQRLVSLLSRREVLFRLIGAEHVTASTLCLLLKGVAVACSNAKNGYNPVAEFLNRVAPPPLCCILVVVLREQAIVLGATLGLAPRLIACGAFGNFTSFVLGILAGAYAAHAVLYVWFCNRADLDASVLRVALLVPGGVSGRAKGVLRAALTGARTRAVQMMAMGLLDRLVRWLWGPKLD
jgi:hypothetical protein